MKFGINNKNDTFKEDDNSAKKNSRKYLNKS